MPYRCIFIGTDTRKVVSTEILYQYHGYQLLGNNIEIGKGPSKQHIDGDFLIDLVSTVKEAFEDKLENEINFIEN